MQEIVKEVQNMPISEQREIVRLLTRNLSAAKAEQSAITENEVADLLLAQGIIDEIPEDWNKPDAGSFLPIEIKGKPVSETILEDRN